MGLIYTQLGILIGFILFAARFSFAYSTDLPLIDLQTQNPDSLYNINHFSKVTLLSDTSIPLWNASGVTLNKKENLLYVIINNLNQIHIYEVTEPLSNIALQTVSLKGWSNSSIKEDKDLEDIVYLGLNEAGQSEFALVSEGSPRNGAEVYICELNFLMTTLDRTNCDRIHVDIPVEKSNRGAEGLTYDAVKQIFYIAIEGNESGQDLHISQFRRPTDLEFQADPTGARGLTNVVAADLFNAELKIADLAPDISALVFSEKNKRLYVLSHIGERALDIDLQGNVYGVFPLAKSLQFEGIALDAEQNLIFVSEPNYLFKFYVK